MDFSIVYFRRSISSEGGHYKVYSAISTNNTYEYALNRHTANNPKCTMYIARGNDTDSMVDLLPVGSSGNYYRIKLVNHATNNYLYADGTANLATIRWSTLDASDNGFIWELFDAEVDNGGGTVTIIPTTPPTSLSNVNIISRYNAPIPLSGGTVTVTNIPDYMQSGNLEVSCPFHYGAGFKESTNMNNYSDYTSPAYLVREATKLFSTKVYKKTLDPKYRMYYLFGEAKVNASGVFHPGIDFHGDEGDNIFALYGGVVTHSQGPHGDVCIYNHALNVTFVYLHMKNITVQTGSTVCAGEAIGQQSSVGPLAEGSHLHFEIHPGQAYSPSAEKYSYQLMATIVPYGYMNGVL